jgi:hypothetical protein
MAHKTDLKSLFFPVKEEEVYLKNRTSIRHFKAIVGELEKGNEVFSIVSQGYKLITHQEAHDLGREIYKKVFGNSIGFEVFNIIAPSTKSFCLIDIIDKNYKFHICQGENYFPFLRIANSYNRLHSLQFSIEFCREICSNGVIFGEKSKKLRFNHTKKMMDSTDIAKISSRFLQSIKDDFIIKTAKTFTVNIPRKYFIPLAAKALKQDLYPNPLDPKRYAFQRKKKEKFTTLVNEYTDIYIPQFQETAYTFYNVITHYATNNKELHVNVINGLQKKCGIWLNSVHSLPGTPNINWDDEIKGYKYLLS